MIGYEERDLRSHKRHPSVDLTLKETPGIVMTASGSCPIFFKIPGIHKRRGTGQFPSIVLVFPCPLIVSVRVCDHWIILKISKNIWIRNVHVEKRNEKVLQDRTSIP